VREAENVEVFEKKMKKIVGTTARKSAHRDGKEGQMSC